MATGKIEYVPDYKSPSQRLAVLRAEHERLRSAVVEAAKAWRTERLHINDTTYSDESKLSLRHNADMTLAETTDALLEFEASHAIGQKDGEQ